MRYLINTYILADSAQKIGNLSNLSLTQAIIETGIHDAIAQKLNQKGNLSKNAIAEGIINNVRKTIIRDQLTDPEFYKEMSELLNDLIKQKQDDTQSYEQFLKAAEALVNQLGRKQPATDLPVALHGKPEAIVLFNNLATIACTTFQCPTNEDEKAALALSLDRTVRERAPAGWKGDDDDHGQSKCSTQFSL
jgi:type I restriction enzyme R subunit